MPSRGGLRNCKARSIQLRVAACPVHSPPEGRNGACLGLVGLQLLLRPGRDGPNIEAKGQRNPSLQRNGGSLVLRQEQSWPPVPGQDGSRRGQKGRRRCKPITERGRQCVVGMNIRLIWIVGLSSESVEPSLFLETPALLRMVPAGGQNVFRGRRGGAEHNLVWFIARQGGRMKLEDDGVLERIGPHRKQEGAGISPAPYTCHGTL